MLEINIVSSGRFGAPPGGERGGKKNLDVDAAFIKVSEQRTPSKKKEKERRKALPSEIMFCIISRPKTGCTKRLTKLQKMQLETLCLHPRAGALWDILLLFFGRHIAF